MRSPHTPSHVAGDHLHRAGTPALVPKSVNVFLRCRLRVRSRKQICFHCRSVLWMAFRLRSTLLRRFSLVLLSVFSLPPPLPQGSSPSPGSSSDETGAAPPSSAPIGPSTAILGFSTSPPLAPTHTFLLSPCVARVTLDLLLVFFLSCFLRRLIELVLAIAMKLAISQIKGSHRRAQSRGSTCCRLHRTDSQLRRGRGRWSRCR